MSRQINNKTNYKTNSSKVFKINSKSTRIKINILIQFKMIQLQCTIAICLVAAQCVFAQYNQQQSSYATNSQRKMAPSPQIGYGQQHHSAAAPTTSYNKPAASYSRQQTAPAYQPTAYQAPATSYAAPKPKYEEPYVSIKHQATLKYMQQESNELVYLH